MPSPSPERTLLYPTCGARLRRRPGRCARIVKAPGARCSVHSGGELSPEGRAIISTAAKARHAKQRAAVRRNEIRRFPQGRPKKWLIPRWWRLKLSDAEQATVLAHMAEYDRRVRGGEPRPPWQPSASTTMEARSLESCERALILSLNRPDPPPLKTAEQVYDNVREIEAIIGDAGSEVRLARLAWEIERFRRLRNVVPSPSPLRAYGPLTGRPHVATAPVNAQRRPPAAQETPPDSFRTTVAPSCAVESKDQLKVEIDDRKRLLAHYNLPESSARSLAGELADARGEAAQLAVLDKWIAGIQRSRAMNEQMLGHFWRAAEARDRAAELAEPPWRPSSILPRVTKR
jgi:hypothetical protein